MACNDIQPFYILCMSEGERGVDHVLLLYVLISSLIISPRSPLFLKLAGDIFLPRTNRMRDKGINKAKWETGSCLELSLDREQTIPGIG